MSGARTDVEAVEAANTALYDAVEQADLDALRDLWLDDSEDGSEDGSKEGGAAEEVSVVHPGWPVLNGRDEVLRSYALIMANTDYVQFFLTDVQVSVHGDSAVVSCTENILSGGPAEEDGSAGPLVGGLVVATNVFRRTTEGRWKVWAHHGSPILVEREGEEDDESGEGDVEL